MNVYFARLAAALAGFIVVAILNRLGLEVSEDQRHTIIAWVTQGITGLGMLIWIVLYGVLHKSIDKKINAGDVAKERRLQPRL